MTLGTSGARASVSLTTVSSTPGVGWLLKLANVCLSGSFDPVSVVCRQRTTDAGLSFSEMLHYLILKIVCDRKEDVWQ